jgi:putative oxidoreductase
MAALRIRSFALQFRPSRWPYSARGGATRIILAQSEHYNVGSFPQAAGRPLQQTVAHYAPHVLSILRIVVALLFLEHGTSRMFGFPSPMTTPALFSMYWFAGAIEFVGGVLLALGLFTRTAALIMSGEMAFAYFISHAPHGFFPMVNRGDAAVLYCFVFFYIAFAGPGPWSLDWLMRRKAV